MGSSQPKVLTNLSGVSLDQDDNGPIDTLSVTLDVVRAVRSGNSEDQSNGFLRDLEKPRVIGGWPITVDSQASDPAGEPGLDFLIDLTFSTTCRTDAAVGDVITVIRGEFPGARIIVLTMSGGDAQAARALIARALGDASRITAEGRGEADPLNKNSTPEEREENRRIEIVLHRPG